MNEGQPWPTNKMYWLTRRFDLCIIIKCQMLSARNEYPTMKKGVQRSCVCRQYEVGHCFKCTNNKSNRLFTA